MSSHKWTAALAVAVLFALQPTTSNAQSRIGSAHSVKPEANGSVAGTLSAGSGVHANETVRTGSSGQAGLRFIDSTNLSVGASSTVRLDKFVYDPNKGTGSVAIDASRGALRLITGPQNKGDFKVKTPVGTLGVRG
jgi:trimeric autotransporter adhesin